MSAVVSRPASRANRARAADPRRAPRPLSRRQGRPARALRRGAADGARGADPDPRPSPARSTRRVLELWQRCGMPAGPSLVAVGGYGRGELFPHSDVDVLVLLPGDGTRGLERMRQATERFITDCWDAGLEIGSSVRTVEECVAIAVVRRHRADRAARIALPRRRPQGLRRLPEGDRQGDGREGVPARQDAGDEPAPPEVREHALLARAELQGEPGRPARPADRDLGGARRGPRPHLAAARRPRPDHAVRGAPAAAQRRAC